MTLFIEGHNPEPPIRKRKFGEPPTWMVIRVRLYEEWTWWRFGRSIKRLTKTMNRVGKGNWHESSAVKRAFANADKWQARSGRAFAAWSRLAKIMLYYSR